MPRLRLPQDLGAARAVVGMRVADEQDFDVRKLEAELLDARADERDGFPEAAIDQDVPLGRRDEV